MGTRRDDITGMERAQIAMEMLPSYRPYGKVSELAKHYDVSRQTLYVMADKGKGLLEQMMEPGAHGALVQPHEVQVDEERIERGTVVWKRCLGTKSTRTAVPICWWWAMTLCSFTG